MAKAKRWIPTYRAKSIYDIPLSFYKENNIKIVLSDLDNTLDAFNVKEPNERTFELVKDLKEAGVLFMIASNNTSKRVNNYANKLGIRAVCRLHKPSSKYLKRFIESEHFNPEEVVLIGDQVLTDLYAGNGAGIRTILTEPVSPLDPPWTKVNRILEKTRRRKIYKMPYNVIEGRLKTDE